MSAEDLALAADIALNCLGGVERGQRNPSFKKLCAIAKVLQRDVCSFYRGLPLPHVEF
jgi:transcriptional regulator with XRE-family HTH domain